MNKRLELHNKLKEILGSSFVYFQPPESIRLSYPCIIYSINRIDTKHADNKPYLNTKSYTVTIIDKDPDSIIPDKFLNLPLCKFDRFFTSDNLNHWVFNLYY